MRKLLLGALSAVLVGLAQPAAAAEGHLAVHGNLSYGNFKVEESCCPGPTFSETSHPWSVGLGIGFAVSRFFADLNLERFDLRTKPPFKKIIRTDLVFTAGARITDWLSAFGGVRRAWEDESKMFGNSIWDEYGFFLGPGLGPFPLGDAFRLSFSAAYNFNQIRDPSTAEYIDYNGISGKLRLGLAKTPHAVELRYQRFKTGNNKFNFDNTNTYLLLGYVFTWNAVNFGH
jgi:hypothetical protein